MQSAITEAITTKRSSHLFEMRDGRSILLALDAADDGFVGLEFTDVSYVVRTALSRQRDVLNGLPNRLKLQRRLEEQDRTLPARSGQALLYIDLDRFKIVNDTLGHPIGDALLKLVADRMSPSLATAIFSRVWAGTNSPSCRQAASSPRQPGTGLLLRAL
jgi:GGDEF domain-containing protein